MAFTVSSRLDVDMFDPPILDCSNSVPPDCNSPEAATSNVLIGLVNTRLVELSRMPCTQWYASSPVFDVAPGRSPARICQPDHFGGRVEELASRECLGV